MRLLCDEMLARLARLLRAAGHDTGLAAAGAADRALLEQAVGEDRMLVTRDRRLAQAAGARGLLLVADGVDQQARELGERLGLDWTLAPFTRCLIDNTPLEPASELQIAAMPASVQGLPGPFNACPECGRLFWPGSHVKRLAAKLARLQASCAIGEAGNESPAPPVQSHAFAPIPESEMSKHQPSGHTPTTLPADDLESNPGIGESKGTTISGEDPSLAEGDNTVEGDVANDVNPAGGVDPSQRGRTNP